MKFFKISWIPLKITILYILSGMVWILLTDKIALLVIDPATYMRLHYIRMFSIVVLACMLYYLVHRNLITKLKETEWNYTSLLEKSPDAICSFDLHGHFLSVNPATEKITGYSSEELFKMNITSLIIEKDFRKAVDYFNKSIKGDPQEFEIQIKHKNGNQLDLEMKYIPIIKNNRITGLHAIAKDITKNKNEENELRSTKELLESFINNTAESISVMDISGKYLRVNKSFEKLYGWTAQELVGNGVPFSESIQEINNWFEMVSTGGETIGVETKRKRKDGKLIEVSATVSPIRDSVGNVFAMSTISRDISDRKRAEEILRKSEKLAVVGQLAAGVAHEIRNPLTALKGFTQLLSADEKKKEYCSIMMGELERINEIVNEFLMIAKPQVENFKEGNLCTILEDVITLLNAQAIMSNVQIVIDITNDIPMITCDENQLKQVFINILKNAIEAMPGGGDILIQVKQNQQKGVIVRIIDQGYGITEDRLPKLGEPFYTTKEKGTGLGLMVTYRIIEAHQGKIEFSSKVNEGTTVSIFLPAL